MRVAVLQDKLDRALKQIKHIVELKSTLPVLSCVLLRSGDATMLLGATDMEQTLEVAIGARVDMEGPGIALPYATLAKLVAALPPERVDISVDYSTLTATFDCGRKHFELKGLSADEFPELKPVVGQFEVMSNDLQRAINQTLFAACTDAKTRPVLNAICIESFGDNLEIATTDGYRMAIGHVKVLEGEAPPFNVVIPMSSLPGLQDFLKNAVGIGKTNTPFEVKIQCDSDNKKMGFASRNTDYWTQLYDGRFPAFRAIVPKEIETEIFADRVELLEAVTTSRIYCEHPLFNWDSELMQLQIVTGSAEHGKYVENLQATGIGKRSFVFEAKHLTDTLSHLKSQMVTLSLSYAVENPIMIILGNDEVGNPEHVICGLNKTTSPVVWWGKRAE